MKKRSFLIFVSMLAFAITSAAQEVKWRIERTTLQSGMAEFRIVLTESLSQSDCHYLRQAFHQKEGIKVTDIHPGTYVIIVQSVPQVRDEDVRAVVTQAGLQVAQYDPNEETQKK